jgi:hypothetical protein
METIFETENYSAVMIGCFLCSFDRKASERITVKVGLKQGLPACIKYSYGEVYDFTFTVCADARASSH